MAKKKATVACVQVAEQTDIVYRHNRGVIKDNALQALLHDRLFRQRIERKLKVKVVTNVKRNTQGNILKSPIIKFLNVEIL